MSFLKPCQCSGLWAGRLATHRPVLRFHSAASDTLADPGKPREAESASEVRLVQQSGRDSKRLPDIVVIHGATDDPSAVDKPELAGADATHCDVSDWALLLVQPQIKYEEVVETLTVISPMRYLFVNQPLEPRLLKPAAFEEG